LSNHGGRQLDRYVLLHSLFWTELITRARTGFDSLRAIHAEDPKLSSQIELYVDGGVRRGSDVLMAVALGAKGVGLGRSFLYAQAAYGEKGTIRAVRSESSLPRRGALLIS
jgi:L-lactate dehydrogenase (cytochrome)